MDLFASLFFSPGILPDFFLRHGWRNTRGGQDGRESCRACTDGATHAEARMAGSRVADSAEKKSGPQVAAGREVRFWRDSRAKFQNIHLKSGSAEELLKI